MFEFEDIANIAMLCFLMGIGVAAFLGFVFIYIAASEFLDTFYWNRDE